MALHTLSVRGGIKQLKVYMAEIGDRERRPPSNIAPYRIVLSCLTHRHPSLLT